MAQQASLAGKPADAVRWLERAHLLIPDDKLVALTLASQLLTCGDPARAVALLTPLAHRDHIPLAWMALGSAHLALGAAELAVSAIQQALQRTVVTAELAALAGRIVTLSDLPGWCGLGEDGRLQAGPGEPSTLLIDGQPRARSDRLEDGDSLVVSGPGGAFLGSPLPLRRLCAIQGFVAETSDGLAGWAWYPGNPDRRPPLTVRGPTGFLNILADAPADGIEDLPPLARPRRFNVAAATLASLGSPIMVTDPSGRHLLGSPIWPRVLPNQPNRSTPQVNSQHRETDIVVPVYGNADETLACLNAVLASVPAHTVVHVVDDASPDGECAAALDKVARTGRIRLHRHPENRGFPSAANTGLRAAAERDVVLLNSDTLVPPGWLERLRAAAYAAPDIGTATPLSNDGTIVSYDGAGAPLWLDAMARRANAGLTAELPVGVGFCLYLRRDCLDQVGAFREDLFAQGYGEESDFCLRARHSGWRHVAALGVLVAHHGGRSFPAGRADLRRRNQAILERHHPEYAGMIADHASADPLFAARRRIDALRWAEGRRECAVVLVSHGEGGGVAELVAARAGSLRDRGIRPVVLVPAAGGCRIEGYDDLRFAVPGELPALAALLRPDQPTHLEAHHWLGHSHGLLGLATLLDIPLESWVHDAASFCPRIALIGRGRRYCGEPAVTACAACVAELGSNLAETITADGLVARSAMDFGGSRRVVVPTADTAQRIRRHFPAVRPEIVPWEDDRALPPQSPAPPEAITRVCVVGAIGVEKGYDVLLGCAADARARALPLEFVVCGVTEDDGELMAAGPAFVTGRYEAADAVGLIRAQRGHMAFIPSIWPETWCFALSRAWQAGLPAVAFDLGAQAERVRATGRGTLLPLGLPVSRINDALLQLAPASAALQP